MAPVWPALERIVVTEKLRRYAGIFKARHDKVDDNTALKAQARFEEQKRLYLQSEFLEHEFESLESKILDAARRGNYEVEALNFPAAYCTDGGRAINNSEPGWPDTLQGKAHSFHLIWKQYGQPKGYRMKAQITSFPGGFIGDVGIFINWS